MVNTPGRPLRAVSGRDVARQYQARAGAESSAQSVRLAELHADDASA